MNEHLATSKLFITALLVSITGLTQNWYLDKKTDLLVSITGLTQNWYLDKKTEKVLFTLCATFYNTLILNNSI